MDGKKHVRLNSKDFNDPFHAGQMVGMLVMMTFFEKNQAIPDRMLDELRQVTAENAAVFLQIPVEDVHLMIDNLVKEM